MLQTGDQGSSSRGRLRKLLARVILGMHAAIWVAAGCQVGTSRTPHKSTSSQGLLPMANFLLSASVSSAAADGTAVC